MVVSALSTLDNLFFGSCAWYCQSHVSTIGGSLLKKGEKAAVSTWADLVLLCIKRIGLNCMSATTQKITCNEEGGQWLGNGAHVRQLSVSPCNLYNKAGSPTLCQLAPTKSTYTLLSDRSSPAEIHEHHAWRVWCVWNCDRAMIWRRSVLKAWLETAPFGDELLHNLRTVGGVCVCVCQLQIFSSSICACVRHAPSCDSSLPPKLA